MKQDFKNDHGVCYSLQIRSNLLAHFVSGNSDLSPEVSTTAGHSSRSDACFSKVPISDRFEKLRSKSLVLECCLHSRVIYQSVVPFFPD